MKLNPSQKNQVRDWLAGKAPSGQQACPVCDQTNWRLEESLVSMPVVGEKPSIAIPFVSFACENCGHARLFFAKSVGLDV
jgi:predicted nucleic-acid-binding Zn-ribbon protein